MSRVELLTINLDGTYSAQSATVGDKHVVGRKHGAPTVTIGRTSAFPKTRPHKFDTVAELLAYKTPKPPLKVRKRQVLAGYNDAWTVQWDEDEGLPARVQHEAEILLATAEQQAVYLKDKEGSTERFRANVLLFLAAGAGVLAVGITILAVVTGVFK